MYRVRQKKKKIREIQLTYLGLFYLIEILQAFSLVKNTNKYTKC